MFDDHTEVGGVKSSFNDDEGGLNDSDNITHNSPLTVHSVPKWKIVIMGSSGGILVRDSSGTGI